MTTVYEVSFLSSKHGKNPIACYRLNAEECYTFYYVCSGRRDKNEKYYSCNQCKKVDGQRGSKQLHLNGTIAIIFLSK